MNEDSTNLESRRKEMLSLLQTEMRFIHQRRRRNCKGVAAAAFVLIVAGTAIWQFGSPNPDVANNNIATPFKPEEANAQFSNDQPRAFPPHLRPFLERTPSGMIEKFQLSNSDVGPSTKIHTIDDDELLTMLAEQGKPTTLGRVDGELKVFAIRSF